MNNQVTKKALEIIKQKNHHANQVANFYLQKALKDDDFNANYHKLKDAEIQNARAEVFGEALPFDLQKLTDKQNKILKKLDINPSNLVPNYSCKKCNDTGYVNNQMCTCLKAEINKQLFEKSGLKHTLASFEDANTQIFDNAKEMEKIYSTLKAWSTKKESKYLNVILTGKTGVGKTHLMECIADAMIKNGDVIYYTSAFNFNQNLLKFHTTFDNTKYQFIDDMLSADCLFIDDLGSEAILKNVTQEGLYNILSERMLNNKKTVISTNLNLSQIAETYGERIFSRLVTRDVSLCINITNQDLRLKAKK